MVSSIPIDLLADPSAALVNLFDPNADLDAFPATVSRYFSSVYSSLDALQEIPALNLAHPPESHKDRALVRFRAMIQDTSPAPDIYLARSNAGKCLGWGLAADDTAEPLNYAYLKECLVLWAVSVPGESSWCTMALDSSESSEIRPLYKSPYPHKYPDHDAPHIGVQIKIYDTRNAQSLKSTELYTFVGILTSEPLYADIETTLPSVVPTIHVFFLQPIPTTIVPRNYPYVPVLSPHQLRGELITWIANESLAGDRVAAEWVLLSAISRVQSRAPSILPLSLNITQFPSPPSETAIYTPVLSHVLSSIFPILSTLPLSLDKLNSSRFAPESKNEDLSSGSLQLPAGSICLVTESGITAGTLSEQGLASLRVVQEVMNEQVLEYAFPFSQFTFDTDIAILVLSAGTRSAFFQTRTGVPLVPVTLSSGFDFYKSADAIVLPEPEKLEMFRHFVGSAKTGNVSINEDTAQFIQNDFVQERQVTASKEEALSTDDLIRLMLVARLLALSIQATEITVPIWEMAKTLEAQRKLRANNDQRVSRIS